MANKLVHVFFDVNLGCQHDGLSLEAKKVGKIDTEDLAAGELLLFINRRRDKIKVLASIGRGPRNCVLAYWRGKDKQVLDEMAIQYIARAFDGTTINYNQALRKAIEQRLAHSKSDA